MTTELEITEIVIEETTPITITHNPYQKILVFNGIKTSLKSLPKKFHAGYFRITLSLGWQALLWKTLQVDRNQTAYHKNNIIHALFLLAPSNNTHSIVLFSLYLNLSFLSLCLKIFILFQHGQSRIATPCRCQLSFHSMDFMASFDRIVSFSGSDKCPYHVFWWVLAIPVVALDVKIYGQWFTKGKWFLSTVVNPTSQLSIIGNLVSAKAAAIMGWKESAMCLFSLGIVHHFLVFVTLYQRLSGSDHRLSVMLRPCFFFFFAAPSASSLAWLSISGAFDTASKMPFYPSLFLFTSLGSRFRRRFRHRFNYLSSS